MDADLFILLNNEGARIIEGMGLGSGTSIVNLIPRKGSVSFSTDLEAKIMAMADDKGDPMWRISPGMNSSYPYTITTISQSSLLLDVVKKLERAGISAQQIG